MTKNILKYSGALLLAGTLAFTGCKKLEDINHDPNKPTTAQPPYLLTGAQKGAMDILYSGLQNGYMGMHFSQYWSGNARTNDSRYLLDEGNNSNLWNNLYRISLHNLDDLIKQNTPRLSEPGVANQNAIAKITQAWIYQILADAYGNIPYTETFQEANITPKYDDARTVYNAMLDNLQQQINVLNPNEVSFLSGDIIYSGNVLKWKKLAHSLMLRYAIRMIDADKDKAGKIIEAHYQDAFSSNDDDAQFNYIASAPNKFPFNNSEREISDFFVSTTMVDYMKSVSDPRLNIYAQPAKGDTIKGMPYGLVDGDKSRLPAVNYSYPGKQIYSATMPGILMNYAEVEFILAEAAARGLNVGDAATHYRNGITASINYWYKLTTGQPAPQDIINTYLSKVPYNAADWKNVIGTQKWLALYPQGFQSWFERTRLKFRQPGGQPLFNTLAYPSLDPTVTDVPYRLTYLLSEQTQNIANYQQAAAAIGGDTKGTKLWYNKF
ncbi:SusD/RagB family nutrient-binding outer membrane lipoprotein [Chitinophaga nivalis]|uniref:SusD/RagB family nutrient-binding outer membrane lipoprotein n=1 Tax=Chitinophaga nivalis TaxID=2991709 RepID=A0ABT3IU63_9BACT|nr:SusD/RagB family nutrient-binding outer membrane lipoprotein [Chitinophaga nivalis]MCW3462810.1 SusD/RagB family nutrient-binding outer membrane lipoprotein [Chitinophaga nivalis]MCW3487500.1 SusD/RagB family nutrient-binding outer membrane lipoprotein [Chitinophaga nivalis]